MIIAKCTLRPGKESSVKRFHPWIFSGAIKSTEPKSIEGELVEVFDSNELYLCTGYYQIGSISIRVLTYNQEEIDFDYLAGLSTETGLKLPVGLWRSRWITRFGN